MKPTFRRIMVQEAKTATAMDKFAAQNFLVLVDITSTNRPFPKPDHGRIEAKTSFSFASAVRDADSYLTAHGLSIAIAIGGHCQLSDAEGNRIASTMTIASNALEVGRSDLHILRAEFSEEEDARGAEELGPEHLGLLRVVQIRDEDYARVFPATSMRADFRNMEGVTDVRCKDVKMILACEGKGIRNKKKESFVMINNAARGFGEMLHELIASGHKNFIARVGEEGKRIVGLVSTDRLGRPVIKTRKLSNGGPQIRCTWQCSPTIAQGSEIIVHPAEFAQVIRYGAFVEERE
ncbi:hypothetical protein HY988_02675 [Candidatus Micrarchaeota archaeon]|nr:hypothetical protein [Candidatus Micrarchaeota archaeon]